MSTVTIAVTMLCFFLVVAILLIITVHELGDLRSEYYILQVERNDLHKKLSETRQDKMTLLSTNISLEKSLDEAHNTIKNLKAENDKLAAFKFDMGVKPKFTKRKN